MHKKRWLAAGCLALALALAGYKVQAQYSTGGPNYVQQLWALVTNIPQVVLNSISTTYYGLVWSSDTAAGVADWNLGYGTSTNSFTIPGSQVTTGNSPASTGPSTSLLAWDINGWLSLKSSYLYGVAGSLPMASSCGTSPSGTEGSDQAGDVTVGASPTNNCTITFANKPAQVPLCLCNDGTAGKSCGVTGAAVTGFSMVGNGGDTFAANDVLSWFCAARQ